MSAFFSLFCFTVTLTHSQVFESWGASTFLESSPGADITGSPEDEGEVSHSTAQKGEDDIKGVGNVSPYIDPHRLEKEDDFSLAKDLFDLRK